MKNARINKSELNVGEALPWAAYDGNGTLLLQKGSIISSAHQLDILLDRGLYRSATQSPEAPLHEPDSEISSNPFDTLNDLVSRISGGFTGIIKRQDGVESRIMKICAAIQKLCTEYPDVALGSVHLFKPEPYTIHHPLHTAILCELLATRLGYEEAQRLPVIAASLTSNIAMLELQEILHHQAAPLTGEQKLQIHGHPRMGVQMLESAGVQDSQWLALVAQHHERLNGTGYPGGLAGDEILGAVQIISVADRYGAMVSARSYRKPMTTKRVLREFFLSKGEEIDELTILSFIKELGIFPPGTFVKLSNDETAVVIRRNVNSMWPTVCSIRGPNGAYYAHPLQRVTDREPYTIKDAVDTEVTINTSLKSLWGMNNL